MLTNSVRKLLQRGRLTAHARAGEEGRREPQAASARSSVPPAACLLAVAALLPLLQSLLLLLPPLIELLLLGCQMLLSRLVAAIATLLTRTNCC